MKSVVHLKILQPRVQCLYNSANTHVSTQTKLSQTSVVPSRAICFSRINNKFITKNALKSITFRQNHSTSATTQTQESTEVGTDHQSIGKHQELFMLHPLSPGTQINCRYTYLSVIYCALDCEWLQPRKCLLSASWSSCLFKTSIFPEKWIHEEVNFAICLFIRRGYEEVITPQLFNKDLWKISGHYDNYKNDMFNVTGARYVFYQSILILVTTKLLK